MKINRILTLMILLLFGGTANSIPWPLAPQGSAHATNKTYGDWNGNQVIPGVTMGYHGGVDLPADSGTPIYAVIDGVVSYIASDSGGHEGFINISTDTLSALAWHYAHIHPDTVTYLVGDSVHIGDCLGHVARFISDETDTNDHLHFQRSNNDYASLTGYLNPLDSLLPYPAQMPFIMDRPGGIQHHPKQIYYVKDKSQDTTGYCYEISYLRDSVDIIVYTCTVIEGCIDNGIYSVGYCVQPTTAGDSISFKKMLEMRDTISEADSQKYNLTYAHPLCSQFRNFYIVTNCGDSLSPTSSGLSNIEESCWPTKINIAGTADADSIEDARFPDGYYVTTIKVWSHSNDSAVALDTVLVDNFNPRVKETRPSDWFAFVPTMEKRVWCTFSEQMDTSTLNSANIKSQSLRADSFNYVITNLIYDDSICKLTLEVDSFRFKDTVQVRLLDGVKDLAGKSIDTTGSEQTIAYSWTFVVGVIQLTDNDVNDMYPDVYHGNVVWTRAAAGSDIGEIMLYDFYGDTSFQISPGGGSHTIPYIFDDEVAWIRWLGSESEYVYYYDGNSPSQIAPATRGRYSMEVNDGGVVWRSYRFSGWNSISYTDTIWVEYYDPDSDSLYTLDSFLDFEGRVNGRVDIDADQVVWDGEDTTISGFGQREVYYYETGMTQNLTEDTVYDDGTPDVSYGQVAWIKERGGGSVWFHDGASQREVTDQIPVSHSPCLHNGSIAWVDGKSIYPAELWHLYFFDGRDTFELMNRWPGGSGNPPFHSLNMHNNQAVWVRLVYEEMSYPYFGYYNATLYDGENVVTLTADSLGTGRSSRIEIHDGFVVYDAWDGNDYEIYLYIGDTLFTPPALARNVRNEILVTGNNEKKDAGIMAQAASKSPKKTKNIDEADTPTWEDAQVRVIWSPNSEPDLAGYNVYRS
ncbi:M23 family metallopeptidase [candidate division WOR-3 bacterium]|nr:M23 family metallopeptidase [candidate division WOR-3 bacterium]